MENKWRKFSEERPKDGEMIWAYDGKCVSLVGAFPGASWATHWMPAEIPQPPEPGKE